MIVQQLGKAVSESLKSVLPIFAIVLILSITLAPINSGVLVMFLFGTLIYPRSRRTRCTDYE